MLILTSCGARESPPITDTDSDSTKVQKDSLLTLQTDGQQLQLLVTAPIAVIRASADPAAPEIARARQGQQLRYLNEVTSQTTSMTIQGINYDEPWLKVQTPHQQVGWVFGGTIRFDGLSDQKLARLVFDKRLNKQFGLDLAGKIKVYQQEIEDVQTLPAFRMLFRRATGLRPAIEKQINEQLALAPKKELPDFFWINASFPGFLVHLVHDNTEYRLFRDFRYWQKLAEQTPDQADNLLVQAYLSAYRSDSIEFLHQDWRLALSEEETYSLLGRGVHKETLDRIETALQQSPDFKQELNQLKQQLIDDISLSNLFWEDRQSILEELDTILKGDYRCLSKPNKVELQARRNMLEQPQKFGIQTNLFEGGKGTEVEG